MSEPTAQELALAALLHEADETFCYRLPDDSVYCDGPRDFPHITQARALIALGVLPPARIAKLERVVEAAREWSDLWHGDLSDEMDIAIAAACTREAVAALDAEPKAMTEPTAQELAFAKLLHVCPWSCGGDREHLDQARALIALGVLPPSDVDEAGDPDYMCPNCVTPWKCNGPHIPEPTP